MKNIKILFSILLVLTLCSCGKTKESSKIQEVKSVKVGRGSISKMVMFTGSIEAEDAIDIYPRATGKVLKKILKEGDKVKRDQPILTIERDEVGYSFKPMPVVSPIDGIIGKISVDVGTLVSPNAPILTIVRSNKMRIKLNVPEKYLNTIKAGQDVSMKVDTLQDKNFDGKITIISPYVEENTRTARIEAEIVNQNGLLKHGMFGRIELPIEKHDDVLIIPNDSISWEGDKQFVYKIKDNKAVRTQITTGIRNTNTIEVLNGLSENDEIINGDLLDIKDNEQIKVINN